MVEIGTGGESVACIGTSGGREDYTTAPTSQTMGLTAPSITSVIPSAQLVTGKPTGAANFMLMPSELTTWSDERLVEGYRLRPWERRLRSVTLSRGGFVAAVVIAAVPLVVLVRRLPLVVLAVELLPLLLVWLVLSTACFFAVNRLPILRRRRHWRELARRYAGRRPTSYLDLYDGARPSAGREPQVVVLTATAPSPFALVTSFNSSDQIRRLVLHADGSGSAEIGMLHGPAVFDDPDVVSARVGRTALTADEVAELTSLVRATPPGRTRRMVASGVFDGWIENTLIWQQGQGVTHRTRHYGGLFPHGRQDHPFVTLIRFADSLWDRVECKTMIGDPPDEDRDHGIPVPETPPTRAVATAPLPPIMPPDPSPVEDVSE